MENIKNIWKASDRLEIDLHAANRDVESEWKRLEASMHSSKRSNRLKWMWPIAFFRKNQRFHIGYFLRVAVLTIVMVGPGVLISYFFYNPDIQGSGEFSLYEFSTAKSQLAEVQLSDGSKINLSVESMIRRPEDYYRGSREVYLEGHAYFDVKSDPKAPFTVQTSSASIRAIGTDFSVRSYPDDERTQVVVVNGKVEITSSNVPYSPEIFVGPGERVIIDRNEGRITKSEVDPANYLAWLDRRIVFEENTFAEMARELERWFGASFVIQDEALRDRKITAVMDSRSITHVLEVLSNTMDVEYRLDDQKIYINERN